jgi:hypothetical protein
MATSTVCAVLKRLGLNRLSKLEAPEPPNRYCRRHPGELIHVDVKKLSRFNKPGHRVTGRGPGHCNNKPGWRAVHVCVDDTSRLAYVEVLPDEKAITSVGFLERAIAWFAERGMTDNGARQITPVDGLVHRPRRAPPTNPPLPAPHQRQSGTLHPDHAARVGLRCDLPERPAPHEGADRLARLLQQQAATERPRPQDPRQLPHPG